MKPNVGQDVERIMNQRIDRVIRMNPFMTRVLAARFILQWGMQSYFWQTPEGEYLEWVARS